MCKQPTTPPPPSAPRSFAKVIDEEDYQIGAGAGASSSDEFKRVVAQPGSAEEPWLAATNRDRVGLALSGGGIRSATFNLGLLQALRHKRLLEHIDYLSTVSGGGYIGGFWTAWRQRSEECDPKDGKRLLFPKHTANHLADGVKYPQSTSPKDIRERPEIRHLREFGRFLMPRVGFMDAETWNGIVAILFGLLPSMFVTLATIGAGLAAWLLLGILLVNCHPLWQGALVFILSFVIHREVEMRFQKRNGAEPEEFKSKTWLVVSLLISGLSAGLYMGAFSLIAAFKGQDVYGPLPRSWVFFPGPLDPPWAILMPAIAWILASGALMFTRLVFSRMAAERGLFGVYFALALDRGIARCLVPALVWTTLGGLWLLAVWLLTSFASLQQSMGISGATAALFATLFTVFRKWLVEPVEATTLRTLLDRLKPILPQVLAYVAVAFLFVLVCQALLLFAFQAQTAFHADLSGTPMYRVCIRIFQFFCVCLIVILFALWLFDAGNVGLHEFYRSRIARCFLGAANADSLNKTADQNRYTNERRRDDLHLGDIPADITVGDPLPRPAYLRHGRPLRLRPIHLVCCAANNLAGDPLGTLYRGARSAVLSQRGVSLGNETAHLDTWRLSSALTASAAAFNSNMGSISVYLGLPVSFLMTALNLRLGLWVPHPRNPNRGQHLFPGQFFFYEMFGRTTAGSLPPAIPEEEDPNEESLNDRFPPAPSQPTDKDLYLHLSDGGHFENLGLYELVRRHCRYIIVSDCGADPRYSFDDLANAIRKVREDFGVEIELDVDPLKPNAEGISRQHVVAGIIHYDGVTGCDKGTILYFKPALTGNESRDVLQYKVRNPVFPHESTGDQFYDAAQWESYHRLGEHSGHECFRFVESLSTETGAKVETLFRFATEHWQAGWAEQGEQFLALTARFTEIESQVRDHAPAFLRAEFFPEVAALHPESKSNTGSTQMKLEALLRETQTPVNSTQSQDDEIRAVYFLMLAIQVMEDAWVGCKLDIYWSHPMNSGWMTYLHRWSSTPSFRCWWPVLKPIYSIGFRNFVEQRFGLKLKDSSNGKFSMKQVTRSEAQTGLAWRQWRHIPDIKDDATRIFLQYDLALPSAKSSETLQVGIVAIEVNGKMAQWNSNQFFVPPALDGAGFIHRFLEATLDELEKREFTEVRVTILDDNQTPETPEPRRDLANRTRRRQRVDFYKSRKFEQERTSALADESNLMTLTLPRP